MNIASEVIHYSTFFKDYERRFLGTDLFEKIFNRLVEIIIEYGLLRPEEIFVDGTHVKAHANTHKYKNGEASDKTKAYQKLLEEEINQDRLRYGKKPLKTKESEEVIEVTKEEIEQKEIQRNVRLKKRMNYAF